MVDVLIIGGGICGCSLFYELSRYRLNVVLAERENDVAVGTTKANSAIVHAGYDPLPGSRMARYNVEGSQLIKKLCEKLDVPYKQVGSLVLALADGQEKTLEELYRRGVQNGVPALKLLSRGETLALEPGLSPEVRGALYAPTAAIVCPWALALALAETAVRNGGKLSLDTEVTGIRKADGHFTVQTTQGVIEAKYVVNAAGIWSDSVNDMADRHQFTVRPSRGEYYLMDKSQGNLVSHVIFQCPDKNGKGVLVAPTVDGNLIVGPNASPAEKGDNATTAAGMEFVRTMAQRSVPSINFRDSIRNFAGLRAVTEWDDFIIGESETAKGFFNIAGMKSPGLSSAPAVAKDMVHMLETAGLKLEEKEGFISRRTTKRFRHMSPSERAEAIRENPLYGAIVCRCETVTEGEIVDALHSPIPPRSVDGVKRRCGAGMGRCQGGFCGPRVQQIIARELGIPQEKVPLDRKGMDIITGRTKTEVGQ